MFISDGGGGGVGAIMEMALIIAAQIGQGVGPKPCFLQSRPAGLGQAIGSDGESTIYIGKIIHPDIEQPFEMMLLNIESFLNGFTSSDIVFSRVPDLCVFTYVSTPLPRQYYFIGYSISPPVAP